MKTIAIIITVHNRKEKTLDCLKMISAQIGTSELFTCKVYLTDDGSTDGTTDDVLSLFPDTIIIKGNGDLFWNRGMRKSWEEAAKNKPDYFLWLNNDTFIYDDCFKRLIGSSKDCSDNSIIVGSTKDSRTGVHTYGGFAGGMNRKGITPSEKDLVPCSTFNGNIVLIPQAVFKSLGFNDNYYRHSFGDIDYGYSATKNGFINYVAPGYYGYCSRNNPIPIFRRKCYNMIQRYKLLYSPLGFNPIENFHLTTKYFSILKCIMVFIKLHFNVLLVKDHTKYNS